IAVSESIAFSELDSTRFGIRAARARITSETLPEVLEACDAERIDLLIARCSTDDISAMRAAEVNGFLLTDTLLYYQFDFGKRPIPSCTTEYMVRSLKPGDHDQVREVAAAAFKGYMGHYHADPRLDQRKCDEAYESWAERSCIPGLAADQLFVAERAGRIAGFATLRVNSSEEVEGLLFAVAPEYQRRGVCGLLMVHSLEWTRSQGARRMIISTQITNVSMQKVWCRVGFEPSHSFYTLHKWFDPAGRVRLS
ncbi:MAG TPA: GNAT family N-acetyltransferase, partial [Terriglobales bacterium]